MVRPNREPLSGEVEIDESYVGGPEPGKPGRAAEDKAIVAAAVEKRGKSCGRVRLGVIANVSADVLTAFVDNHLGDGETAHTDGWRGYAQLGNTGYRHIISVLSKLDQTAAEVLPRVHLIFSLLKRLNSPYRAPVHRRAPPVQRSTNPGVGPNRRRQPGSPGQAHRFSSSGHRRAGHRRNHHARLHSPPGRAHPAQAWRRRADRAGACWRYAAPPALSDAQWLPALAARY